MGRIKSVYIAAAIDHVAGGKDPFEWMKEQLAPAQCFNPKAAFAGDVNRNLDETQEFICSINFHAMKRADIIVAYTDLSHFSFGMPMEIMYAAYIGKPLVLVMPSEIKPGVYAQFFSTKIISPEKLNLGTLEEVHDYFYSDVTDAKKKKMKRQFINRVFGGNQHG